jgi:hypothetical protein
MLLAHQAQIDNLPCMRIAGRLQNPFKMAECSQVADFILIWNMVRADVIFYLGFLVLYKGLRRLDEEMAWRILKGVAFSLAYIFPS